MNDSVNATVNEAVSGSPLVRGRVPADQGNEGTRDQGSGAGSQDLKPAQSPSDRLAGFADAQGKPDQPINPEDEPWLVGYRVNLMNSTVALNGFNPALKETLRSKRWATLVRDQGWVIPTRYLAHVERLLDGANVILFDIDGAPTPWDASAQRGLEIAQTRLVLAEIREAQAKHDHTVAHRAYLAASAALAAKLAELHPEPEPSDVAAPVVSLGGTT